MSSLKKISRPHAISFTAIAVLAVAQLFVIRYSYRLKFSELEFVYRNVYEYASPFMKINWDKTDSLTQRRVFDNNLWENTNLNEDYLSELQQHFLDTKLIRAEIESYFEDRDLLEEMEFLILLRNFKVQFNQNDYLPSSGMEELVLDGDPALRKTGTLVYRHIANSDYLNADIDLFIHFPNKNILLVSEMKWVLILSIITFLLISYVAIYNLRNWQKQKEISLIKDDLIDHISHEFRTPITSINIAGESISQNGKALGIDRVMEISELIKRQGKRLQRMVDNLLNAAFLDQQQHTNMEAMALDSFLKKYLKHIDLIFTGQDLHIKPHLYAEEAVVLTDAFLFESMLNNLIDNAIKYNDKSPLIQITSERKDMQYLLTIQDNGIGMEAHQLTGVFEKFQRYNQSSKGLGLGLYHVKQIVDMHKGHISVQSEVGEGTKFIIKLPIQ